MATISLHLGCGIALDFQRIPAGEFRMGERGRGAWEEPVHTVKISQAFYLGRYPVTQEQFALCFPQHKNHFRGALTLPAESLNWDEACSFCDWLNSTWNKNRPADLPEGYMARLPTEAEWEYACRAGTETEYHTGDGEAALALAGWYNGNSGGRTQLVGRKLPNAWGLYDMHGNVWEWCCDAWSESAYKLCVDGAVDPVVDAMPDPTFPWRSLRGGSWYDSPGACPAANRDRWLPVNRNGGLGFRVCLVPGPAL